MAEQFPGPRPEGVEADSEESLATEVANLPERPLAIHDDSELSLAGLADKLLLVEMAPGLWGRPLHGRPSTHILKVEDRRYTGMAEMEAACLRLARAVGLTSVDATTRAVGGVPCLIVSRFDRRVLGDNVVRLHQEDSCQALGRDPEADRGRGKYEASGGPRLDSDVWTRNGRSREGRSRNFSANPPPLRPHRVALGRESWRRRARGAVRADGGAG